MLEKLKNLQLDRVLDMDEGVALSLFARELEAEFLRLDIDVPEWLTTKAEALRAELARRLRADRLRKMDELRSLIETYKSTNQKRADALEQLAKLQKLTGLGTVKAGK